MSITTIYKCDKCNKEVKQRNNLSKIGLTIDYEYSGYPFTYASIEVCGECYHYFKMAIPQKKEAPKIVQPTVEELICQIRDLCNLN